jgi:hypothetical protein
MRDSREMAIGLFHDASRASEAVYALKNSDFTAADVSLFVPSLAIPLVGLFIAAGATALGGGIGTVIGGMAGMSMSRDRRVSMADRDAVVVVRDGNRLKDVGPMLRRRGAHLVEHARDESMVGSFAAA